MAPARNHSAVRLGAGRPAGCHVSVHAIEHKAAAGPLNVGHLAQGQPTGPACEGGVQAFKLGAAAGRSGARDGKKLESR